jgi:hypothetical protein
MAHPAFATTRYIAQTAGTFSGGSACNGQTAITAATWNSTPESPGDVSYVCGTITGTAGQILLGFAWSGSSSNPITLIFDTGAVLASPVWSLNGAINIYNLSNIVINGGTNGTIQNTANGQGLAYNQETVGVGIQDGSSNITVENLTIKNLCVVTAADVTGTPCDTSGNFSSDISVTDDSGGTFSSIHVIGNTLSDAYTPLYIHGTASDTDMLFQHNTVRGVNWGFATDGTNNLTIDGNDIACVVGATCNWDDPDDDNHHDGIFIFPQSFAMKVVAISNNWVHDFIGHTTALYFNDPGGSGSSESGTVFYNNVFSTTAGQLGPANGDVLPPNGATIVNNTFSGPSYALINLESDVVFKNNILVNTSDYVVNIDSVGSGDTFAYNDYYNVDNGWSHNDTADGTTLAAWTSGSTSLCPGGCDATGSITANPSLISTFILQLGSAVIGAGTNLSSIGIAGLSQGAPQTFGANYACGTGCLSRPSSGAWDMGAYPYSSSSIGAKPSSPTNLTGTVVVN